MADSLQTGMELQKMAAQLHKSFRHRWRPEGVYRFKTFEEANQWDWDHMMEAAKKKFRDRLNSRT